MLNLLPSLSNGLGISPYCRVRYGFWCTLIEGIRDEGMDLMPSTCDCLSELFVIARAQRGRVISCKATQGVRFEYRGLKKGRRVGWDLRKRNESSARCII
jgi:hypothetical protein